MNPVTHKVRYYGSNKRITVSAIRSAGQPSGIPTPAEAHEHALNHQPRPPQVHRHLGEHHPQGVRHPAISWTSSPLAPSPLTYSAAWQAARRTSTTSCWRRRYAGPTADDFERIDPGVDTQERVMNACSEVHAQVTAQPSGHALPGSLPRGLDSHAGRPPPPRHDGQINSHRLPGANSSAPRAAGLAVRVRKSRPVRPAIERAARRGAHPGYHPL